MTFQIESINISAKKREKKHSVKSVIIREGLGLAGDAHQGIKNQEVSFLSREEIDQFNSSLPNGSFGENLTLRCIDTDRIQWLDRIIIKGRVVLEVTRKGKTCHERCHIYDENGDCIMPKKGFFARVIRGGRVSRGDPATLIPKTFRVSIMTLSDRASKGVYADHSGEAIREQIQNYFMDRGRLCDITKQILPDSATLLRKTLNAELTMPSADMIFTTGGTGIGLRDITIETVRPFLHKELSGIPEFIRLKYGQTNPRALLSRSICGTRGRSLIFCLPGSVKAVQEYLDEIVPQLDHVLAMIHDIDTPHEHQGERI